MPLVLNERGIPANEVLVRPLTSALGISPEEEITEVALDGRSATFTVQASDSGLPLTLHDDERESFPLKFRRGRVRKVARRKYTFGVTLKEGWELMIAHEAGVHQIVNDFLQRTDPNCDSSLKAQGLDHPTKIDAALEYETPFRVWRGLPEGLFPNLTGFSLSYRTRWPHLEDVSIGWPTKISQYGPMDQTRLTVRQGNPFKGADKEPTPLVRKLLDHGFVSRTVTEAENSPWRYKPSEEILRLVQGKPTYQHLVQIEDFLVAQAMQQGFGESSVGISFAGTLDTDTLHLVPNIYDRLLRKAVVKTPYFELNRENPSRVNATEIIFSGGFERAARILSVIPYSKDTRVRAYKTPRRMLAFGVERDLAQLAKVEED